MKSRAMLREMKEISANYGRVSAVPETGIATVKISPHARTSLFHLRMEARHWGTYCDNMRKRLGLFLTETSQALADQTHGRSTNQRLYRRWHGEKPNVLDDTCIYLAAAFLLAGGQCNKNKGD